MSYRVQVSDEARRQILEIDSWWTADRSSAPDLFWQELMRAMSLLEAMPLAGKVYRRAGSTNYRRLLRRRSQFHVFYLVDEPARVVVVVAVWNANRGHGPPLA